MRFKGELEDLNTVLKIADKWGYGNCIQWLKNMWADSLVRGGLDREGAGRAAGMDKTDIEIYKREGSVWLK